MDDLPWNDPPWSTKHPPTRNPQIDPLAGDVIEYYRARDLYRVSVTAVTLKVVSADLVRFDGQEWVSEPSFQMPLSMWRDWTSLWGVKIIRWAEVSPEGSPT